jgi:hypothetical protein
MLYPLTKGYPDYSDPEIGHRGPYTLDVTYTLERGDNGWQVIRLVLDGEVPAWEEPKG